MHNDDWQRQCLALPKNRFVCAEQWPQAAMRIHARHFSFIFLAFFMLTYMSVDFLHLNKAPHLEEATFTSSPRRFPSLKAKAVCIKDGVFMDEPRISLLLSPC